MNLISKPTNFKVSPRKAKKRLGQHFLRDPGIISRIIDLAAPEPGATVLEIGPGEGVLTEALLARGVNVVAVETDKDLWQPLAERFAAPAAAAANSEASPATDAGPNFHLEHGDFLKVDLDELFLQRLELSAPVAVVANIPYQITTPILFRLIKYRHLFSSATLMIQEEVAARIMAAPGGREYGRLTVGVGMNCEVDPGFKVHPGAFSPPPKVWSRVLRFEFLEQPRYKVEHQELFDRLLLALFSQRRKQIINPLKGILTNLKRDEIYEKLMASGFVPEARPATLTPEEMVRLADCISHWSKI